MKDPRHDAIVKLIEEYIAQEDDFNTGIQSLTKAINTVLVKKYKSDCVQFVLTFEDALEIIPQCLNFRIAKKMLVETK